ncbi:hypothetical protein AYO41_01590 [Verrucomicrobia bacterium SCGC AG-212-E04]|nr:hypothetical protein AYO41_01590 [Verrucomicrobia bacterium SCGC AG-212-E04]
MQRLPARFPTHSALVALLAATLGACAAPPPPATPEPTAPPAKKAKEKAAATPTPVPVAPAPASGPIAPSDQFKVIAVRTPFYKYGPQQPGGPSMSIDYGTNLTLLKRGFGYSQIQLKDQQTGYVATEDIAALTPQELMAQEQPDAPTDLGPLPRPGGVRRSVLPPPTQEALPEPEGKPETKTETKADPKAEPTPKFRY